MAFISFLDPVFNPLLNLHPALAIFIMAFLITVIITLVYKFVTDQKTMKRLKDELKEHQTKIRKISKEDPEKAMKLQGEAMKVNMEYMKHSFKATFYTMIPVLLIFMWMSQNLAYLPITPDTPFTVTAVFADGYAPTATLSATPELVHINNATQEIGYNEALKKNVAVWRLEGGAGEYLLTVEYNNEVYDHEVLISTDKKYSQPEESITGSKLKSIVVGNEKIYPFTIFGLKFTWFWSYVLLSIFMSIGLRKILKVY
ncbi:DUF106 domain-containing protein [Candidatus Woesearchaeota archaeon]|nr:DUF106 domain-containing protein [Candidatus Woesearchaeota archaeon]